MSESVPLSCMSVPPKTLTVTRFTKSVRPSLLIRSHRDWKTMCNGWILCGGYIYPSTSSSFMERAIRTNLHIQPIFSQREPPTVVLRPRYSIPTTWTLISSLPKLLSTQIFFPLNPNPMRESWVLGRLSLEAQEQGVHHQRTICYFLESGVS